MIRRLAASLYAAAEEHNLRNLEHGLASLPAGARLLDIGCDDGARTLRFARASRARDIHGIEVDAARAALARERGITVTVGDLANGLPYPEAAFDAVVSNQVIEHLADTDRFVNETQRVLRPGGLALVSTENLSSWHNVVALLLGWQPFSLTNVSSTGGLGNPFALHRGEPGGAPAWQHLRVFSYRGLRELFETHGLRVTEVAGAGYYPLPSRLGALDPRHAAFLTFTAHKS